jgi:threonine dehydrogenase-like Zn-dependent dehydrogenase
MTRPSVGLLHRAEVDLSGRVAVIVAPGRVEVRTQPVPEPGAGEVRIRLEGCGVCGSNLGIWQGRDWFSYPQQPGTPGHEGWGVIHAVGDGVTGLEPGQRVAALSQHAFAAYDIAPATAVVPVPASLDGMPFPGEPLGCAMNVFRRAGIEAGQTVAIVGIGFLGALLTQLASRAGARVIAISRRPFALEVARACGAHDTVPMDDHARIVDRVRDLTGGAFCDRVVEAVGLQWPLDLAGELTRERGRLVVAGFHQDGPRQVDMFLWNWRGLDVINAHERDPAVYVQGMREAAAAIADGALDPALLYTHEFALDQLGAALDAMRDRPDGFLKALVRPWT